MLTLVNSSTLVRPVRLPVQPFVAAAASQEVCVGVPSCSPLVQLELLRALREQLPEAYTRVWCELGLTVSRTQELVDRRVEIISAARAIKLARMIAREPEPRAVFGEAGRCLFNELKRRCPQALRTAIRNLPPRMRVALALSWTRKMAHQFAGSLNEIATEKQDGGLGLSVRHGLFSDRLETLEVAHEYYRQVFQTMFSELAHIGCELREVKRPRLQLDQCSYQIVWEA